MSVQEMIANEVNPQEKWLYQVGGTSALAVGIAYIIIIALYVPIGAPPSGTEARLMYMARNTAIWWGILGLSVLTDFLFVPVALSLYFALKGINRSAMLVAAACVGLFVILDLAITWTNYAALIALSNGYAAAASDVQRAVFVAAASYPSVVLESSLLFVYNSLTLAVGILMTGFVMLKGVFSRSTAYLGVVTGILGVVAVAGPLLISSLSVTIIIASILTTVWVILVGYRLYRFSQ